MKATRAALGWPDQTFYVPDEVRGLFAVRAEDGKQAHEAWKKAVASFTGKGGPDADFYGKLMARAVPSDSFEELCKAAPAKDAATRAQGADRRAAGGGARALAGRRLGRPEPVDEDVHRGLGRDQKRRFRRAENVHSGIPRARRWARS